MQKKPSFFERLTGSHYYDDDEEVRITPASLPGSKTVRSKTNIEEMAEQEESEASLTVDVYQTPDEIIIEAMIPAVKGDDLDISITREMVTLKGTRERHRSVEDDQYFFRELFWGTFSRTILLPQEVEPDKADAREKNGLLTIILPKSDRNKSHKLKVKSSSQG